MKTQISTNIENFYESIRLIEDHRYKSWEHCYNFFRKIKGKDLTAEEFDLAQLHLAFYLASWGMYRGSSFILQKDYTIFEKIVKELLKKEYLPLWEIEKNIDKKQELNELFIQLYSSIEKILNQIKTSVKNHPDLDKTKRYLNEKEDISVTLITKILLGSIGCIPAYDRYFVIGLGKEGLQKKFNSKKSFSEMINFYENNKAEIDLASKKLKGYPLMKLLDMYFWVRGYENN